MYNYTDEEAAKQSSEMIVDRVDIHYYIFMPTYIINEEFYNDIIEEDVPALQMPTKVDYDGRYYYLKYDWYTVFISYSDVYEQAPPESIMIVGN